MTEEQSSRGLSVIDVRLVEDRDGVWRVSVEGARTRATGDRPSQAIDALARILSGLAWSSETTEQDVVAGHAPELFGTPHPATEAPAAAATPFDLAAFFDAKARWSAAAFGLGSGTEVQVVRHIRKELGEIEQAPTDLEEWVDVVLLAMDGAWRSAGATGARFVEALKQKHEKNLGRTWSTGPDGVTEHVRDAGVAKLAHLTDEEWKHATIERAFQRALRAERERDAAIGDATRERSLCDENVRERRALEESTRELTARVRQLEQAAIGSDAEKVRVLEEQAPAMGEELSGLAQRLAEAERDRDAKIDPHAWAKPGVWAVPAVIKGLPAVRLTKTLGRGDRPHDWLGVEANGAEGDCSVDMRRPATPEETTLYESQLARATCDHMRPTCGQEGCEQCFPPAAPPHAPTCPFCAAPPGSPRGKHCVPPPAPAPKRKGTS